MDIEIQAAHINSDSLASPIELSDERAVDDLLINGAAEFSVGEIELDDVLLAVAENQAIISILNKLVTGDLTAIAELRILTAGAANEKIQQLARYSH